MRRFQRDRGFSGNGEPTLASVRAVAQGRFQLEDRSPTDLVSMKFTEREMTAAVDAVARELFAATRAPWRRGGSDAAWERLTPIERYNRKAVVGEMVLPVLQALPERPTVGATPAFTDEEYAAAAEDASRALLEHRSPGAWDAMPERRRGRLVRSTAALARRAVAAMPVRQDPDNLIVPDHL